jgi:hypothetical protein
VISSNALKRPIDDVADGSQENGKRQRTIVQTENLSILVSCYHVHYADYCRGRKDVSQRIPAKIRKKVYADFVEACHDSILSVSPEAEFNENQLPAERTLQDALRDALDQAGYGRH